MWSESLKPILKNANKSKKEGSKMKVRFDNSTRRINWKTLLKAMLLGPCFVVFNGPGGMTNPLLDTSSQGTTPEPTSTEGQSSQVEPTGTEPTTATVTTTEPAKTEPEKQPEVPINTPTQDIVDPVIGTLKELGLDKFKGIEPLAKSYKYVEQQNSKLSTENAQLKAQSDNILRELEALKANQQVQQQTVQQPLQQTPQGMTPEQIEERNLQLAELVMNDPMAFMKQIQEEAKNQSLSEAEKKIAEFKAQVEPYLQKSKQQEEQQIWNAKVQDFITVLDPAGNPLHPEMGKPEVQQAMAEIFNKIPNLHENPEALDVAYRYAIGQLSTPGNQTAIEPMKLFEDDNFVKQAAMNPKIMELAKAEYLKTIKNGNPPPVMGSTTTGTPSAIVQDKPKNIKEAGRQFLNSIGLK
jgi:hypothetical protein